MSDLRGYINPYVPGALPEAGQREGMVGEIYVEDRRGRQIAALLASVRKGTVVQVREVFYLAPATGDPRVRRRVMGERLDDIKARGGLILELGMRTVRCVSHARLLWAYEQIANSGRARKHARTGRPVTWVFTKAEREVVEGLWTSRKYKTDAERTLAVQQRIGKPIARAWLRRHLGSPHGKVKEPAMQYYRCKCGRSEAWGSMSPYPCSGCDECGTTLDQHPDRHRMPKPHDFSSVEKIQTDQGEATITRCAWCGKRRDEVEQKANA